MSGGTYTLLVSVPHPIRIEVGALGEAAFPAGAYAYSGSALGSGGFARVDRHRRLANGDHEARHWHVDYLLGHPATRLEDAVTTAGVDAECAVARTLLGDLDPGPLDGFGASDCGCSTHLAYAADLGVLANAVRSAHKECRH